MTIHFKVVSSLGAQQREEVLAALEVAGFHAQQLLPGQRRRDLAAVFTIKDAGKEDLAEVARVLEAFGPDIEYVEVASARSLRASTV